MPLSGELKLRVAVDVVGAAGLVLNGVHVLHEAVVEPTVVDDECVVVVVCMCGGCGERG